MSGMYHGTTCGSQLYLPPRCSSGLQDSYHPAPGGCSARTTGYSGKILPTEMLNFSLLFPHSFFFTGQGVRQKALCFFCQSSHPFCSPRTDRSCCVGEKSAVMNFAFLQRNPVMQIITYMKICPNTLEHEAFWTKFWSYVAVLSIFLFLQLRLIFRCLSCLYSICTEATYKSGHACSALPPNVKSAVWIRVGLLICLGKGLVVSIQGLFRLHRCMLHPTSAILQCKYWVRTGSSTVLQSTEGIYTGN